MSNLLKKAQGLDKQHGLDEESIKQKQAAVKDWEKRLIRVTNKMRRTLENPPTDYDLRKLEMVEHYFNT